MEDDLDAALKEIGVEIGRLDEITHGRRLIFLYGPTGAGKTFQAHLLNQKYKDEVGFINYERGQLTVEGSGIRNLEIHDPDKLSRSLAIISDQKLKGNTILDFIYLDSAAEFFEDLLEINAAEAALKKPGIEDPNVPSQRSYLKTRNRTRRLMKWLKDAPFNMVFTSQDSEDQDSSGIRKIVPSLSPSIVTTYFKAVDAILYLHITNQGHRALLTRPVANIHAKSRTPVGRPPLPPIIYEPDLSDIFAYYAGEDIQFKTTPPEN